MVREIQVDELARKMDAGEAVYLVDVRQPWENEYCRLPGTVLIPLPELQARVEEVQPPEGALVVVYCHHGIRSMSGAAVLNSAGIENAVSLAGGIEAWSRIIDPKVPRY